MWSDITERNVGSYLRKRGIKFPPVSVLLPTVGVVASETALFYGFLQYSLAGHLLTLFLCAFAPLVIPSEASTFQVFALVPVFRLVNLGMPVFFELTLYWFPFVYAPLFPAMYLLVRTREDLVVDFDLRTVGIGLIPGALLAILLAEIEYRIITPEALVTGWTPGQILLITAVMVAFVGFVEEILFRGILQRSLEGSLGFWPGILLASFIFGMMHSAYASGLEILFAAVIGFLFGYVYVRTGSIILVTIIHGLLNVVLFGYIPIHGSLFGLVLP